MVKWTRPFLRKTKSGFCACAITFRTQSTVYCKIRTGMIACPSFGTIDIKNIIFNKLFQKQIQSIALYVYKFIVLVVVVIYNVYRICNFLVCNKFGLFENSFSLNYY